MKAAQTKRKEVSKSQTYLKEGSKMKRTLLTIALMMMVFCVIAPTSQTEAFTKKGGAFYPSFYPDGLYLWYVLSTLPDFVVDHIDVCMNRNYQDYRYSGDLSELKVKTYVSNIGGNKDIYTSNGNTKLVTIKVNTLGGVRKDGYGGKWTLTRAPERGQIAENMEDRSFIFKRGEEPFAIEVKLNKPWPYHYIDIPEELWPNNDQNANDFYFNYNNRSIPACQ